MRTARRVGAFIFVLYAALALCGKAFCEDYAIVMGVSE
jgi:hypothetical protein